MNVQTLIYAYLAICVAMIVFNIVCIFVFRRRDKKLKKRSIAFEKKVKEQMILEEISEKDKKYLSRKLCRINYLMAYDEMLEQMYQVDEAQTRKYIEKLSSVFVYLTLEYRKKNKLKAAYFPYIIKKYALFRNKRICVVSDVMLELVKENNFYCKENALQALYSIGNCDDIIHALKIINTSDFYYNPKVITDGLLTFAGNHMLLAQKLWPILVNFGIELRVAILNYFRFYSGDYCPQMLHLISEPKQDYEVIFSCIRYFGKYYYEPAYPILMKYADNEEEGSWEATAIACSALVNYPSDRTFQILKLKLRSRNWYIRYNSSKSLKDLGVNDCELIDIFKGEDRYAAEILKYHFDQKTMLEKGGMST